MTDMGRERGTGSIYKDGKQGPNASTTGGVRPTYRYQVFVNGIRYRDHVSRIIAQFAIGQLFVMGWDSRQVHHVDGDHSNWKPSNLVLFENQKEHSKADQWRKAQEMSWGEFKTIRFNGAVYIGDIIRDDDFDIEIALEWWREQVIE